MKKDCFITLLFFTLLLSMSPVYGTENPVRPKEIRMFINAHLYFKITLNYDNNGNLKKITTTENGKTVEYSRYKIDDNGRIYSERIFERCGILTKTRLYVYDEKGLISSEKVYSPDGRISEYSELTYTANKISKVLYFKNNKVYQSIQFTYNGNLPDLITFIREGEFIILLKPVFDGKRILRGYIIKHTNTDAVIEMKFFYEQGFATEDSLRLIFR